MNSLIEAITFDEAGKLATDGDSCARLYWMALGRLSSTKEYSSWHPSKVHDEIQKVVREVYDEQEAAAVTGEATNNPREMFPISSIVDYWTRTTAAARLVKEGLLVEYKFSCVMLVVPEPTASRIKEFARRMIPSSSLAGEGYEERAHLTLKYGLHTTNFKDVEKVLDSRPARLSGPIEAKMGRVRVFTDTPEHDVVVIEIVSPQLREINNLISTKLQHTDTFAEYKPHLTLAYTKKGEGHRLAGNTTWENHPLYFREVLFTTPAGLEHHASLVESRVFTKDKMNIEITDGNPGSGPCDICGKMEETRFGICFSCFKEGTNESTVRQWFLNEEATPAELAEKPPVWVSCLTGDTEIPLLDGRTKKLAELEGLESFWVYSFDVNKKRIVPGLATTVRKTGSGIPVYRVLLDNGRSVKATADHPWLCRDGFYRQTSELVPGTSLMPLYRTISSEKNGWYLDGYEVLYQPGLQRWQYTHRAAVGPIPKDFRNSDGTFKVHFVVHHKDFDKRNNDPTNLVWLGEEDHNRSHSEIASKWIRYFNTAPEYADIRSATARKRMLAYWERARSDPALLERAYKQLDEARVKGIALGKIGWRHYWESLTEDGYVKRCSFSRELALATKPWTYGTVEGRQATVEAVKECWRSGAWNGSLAKAWKTLRADPERLVARNGKISGFSKQRKREAGRFVGNHKVLEITFCGHEDVYNLDVDAYHNFALDAGVFVHNSEFRPVWSHLVNTRKHTTYAGAIAHYKRHMFRHNIKKVESIKESESPKCERCGATFPSVSELQHYDGMCWRCGNPVAETTSTAMVGVTTARPSMPQARVSGRRRPAILISPIKSLGKPQNESTELAFPEYHEVLQKLGFKEDGGHYHRGDQTVTVHRDGGWTHHGEGKGGVGNNIEDLLQHIEVADGTVYEDLKRTCAWCKKSMGITPSDFQGETHGICNDCDKKVRKEAGLPPKTEARLNEDDFEIGDAVRNIEGLTGIILHIHNPGTPAEAYVVRHGQGQIGIYQPQELMPADPNAEQGSAQAHLDKTGDNLGGAIPSDDNLRTESVTKCSGCGEELGPEENVIFSKIYGSDPPTYKKLCKYCRAR